MITLIASTIGLPTLFLVIKLLLHAFVRSRTARLADSTCSPPHRRRALHLRVHRRHDLGSHRRCSDLADGMFTQQVVTGRSRVASTWPASRPAWPSSSQWWPSHSRSSPRSACSPRRVSSTSRAPPCRWACLHGYETWAADHPNLIICDLPYNGPCPQNEPEPNTPLSRALAERQAEENYPSYAVTYNSPPYRQMIGWAYGSSSRWSSPASSVSDSPLSWDSD